MERLSDELVAAARAHPDYRALRTRRARLAWALTGAVMIAFFGFILLIAFDKPLLARPLAGATTTLGIPLGFAVILLAIALTAFYVRRANAEFDPLIARIRRDLDA